MRWLSYFLIVTSLVILWAIFGPVITQEVRYKVDQIDHVTYSLDAPGQGTFEKQLVPPNTDFSIVIPAIGAVAPIIQNVDPSDPKKYLPALKKGVAHAAGTALPNDREGNVFLFAHSTDTFYNVNTYNAVFYLIGKLKVGDEVDIFYGDKLFRYVVYDKKVVDPTSSQYFGQIDEGNTLTLQTCYPPGTTLKRLIVLAKQVE